VLWHDLRYNNPWSPHVRGMTKRFIRQFFPDFEMHHPFPVKPLLGKLLPDRIHLGWEAKWESLWGSTGSAPWCPMHRRVKPYGLRRMTVA
jgi:hypothetical protein